MSQQSRLTVMMDQRLWSEETLPCIMLLHTSETRLGMWACYGEASSAEEADQQSSDRSVATLLTATGPSWELHGPRVARRLRQCTRCHHADGQAGMHHVC